MLALIDSTLVLHLADVVVVREDAVDGIADASEAKRIV